LEANNDDRESLYLSVSRLKSFLSCPHKHKLQYVERVEPTFRPMALAFGSAFHEAAGFFLLEAKADGPLPCDAVLQVFRDALDEEMTKPGPPIVFDDEGDTFDKAIDHGARMLNVFMTRMPRPEKVIAVELAFELDLAHPTTGEVLPVPFIGAIDAVVEEDNRLVLLELKTAKRRWSADQIEFDLQPTVYRLAASQRGYKDPQVALVIATKTKEPELQMEQPVRTDVDTRELVETATSMLEAVRRGIDYRVRGWQCKTCPFAEACAP
jgi:CRISPR/Cas system-associated exonuclease Cas4 (RecB family)